ncbi:MAG: PEP/pyruvate-binding domain-containing protein [Limisphaerales bacterium]
MAASLTVERPSGGPGGRSHPRLSIPAPSDEVVTLQASRDLGVWSDLLIGHGTLDRVADLREPFPDLSFYRATTRRRTAADDGKNVMGDVGDPFLSAPGDSFQRQSQWIKFALLLDAPHRVWFQDSRKYPFHYEFATARLPDFKGMTRAQFDAVTLRIPGQKAVLGAVIFPPSPNVAEIGIQIVGLDPYPREQVAAWFETVRAMIQRDPEVEVLYLPTLEQSEVARAHGDWFEARGIPVSSAGRWVAGDECYSPGWAVGRLVAVPGLEIAAAYRDGRLLPEDVLLTDQVPAEVPPLAGIVALQPATPNSHVALLAQSFRIPFVHPADEAVRQRVQSWAQRDVMVRAVPQYGGCELTLEAVDGPLDPEARAELLAMKAPPKLDIPARVPAGRISLPTATLRPADISLVGGKAANFGVLVRSLPANVPSPSVAFTLDLWEEYLDQILPGGVSLRRRIQDRLAGFTWPPVMSAYQDALAEIRDWIQDTADFNPTQRHAILQVLADTGFEPTRPIRFRSSTNVEDGEQFNGAGLYDSYSGCLADELDDDSRGPSICDPTEKNERGVFRALRKVYASFYNPNACLERLRHGVNEAVVGMGVLVHPSTPDEFELANGVATWTATRDGARYVSGMLVTQDGAVSVANPDTLAVPERVSVSWFGSSPQVTVDQESSLVPLGGRVMTWPADYQTLVTLLNRSALAYEAEFPAKKRFVHDFEFKKVAPDGLLRVKQIRQVPEPPQRDHVPWLIPTAGPYQVFQGEHGDLVAHHRLKSEWEFRLRTTALSGTNLDRSLLTFMKAAWLDHQTRRVEFGGAPESLPGYSFERSNESLSDRWVHGDGIHRRNLELRTRTLGTVSSREGPLVVLPDLTLQLVVRYAAPQPTLGYIPAQGDYGPTTTSEEVIFLAPATAAGVESLKQERTLKSGAVTVRTSFWWPAPPKGISAGYTAPVQAWIETRITGLAAREIVLRDPWAQTYHPGHHNFFEEFMFEPRLDASVPEEILHELESKNIRAIAIGAPNGGGGDGFAFVQGLDGTFRKP